MRDLFSISLYHTRRIKQETKETVNTIKLFFILEFRIRKCHFVFYHIFDDADNNNNEKQVTTFT